MFGILLAAGHDPDHLINNYSFTQLAMFARAILGHHARILNMLIGPVLASQGIEYNPISVKQPKTRTNRDLSEEELAAKETAKLRAMQASPFKFKTVKTSSDDGDASG